MPLLVLLLGLTACGGERGTAASAAPSRPPRPTATPRPAATQVPLFEGDPSEVGAGITAEGLFYLGAPAAPVELTEFSDFL